MDNNPGLAVEAAVSEALRLVDTWVAWDGAPHVTSDGARLYTPHKAVRRLADHLIDHLAQVECLLADVASRPDRWHGSAVTLDSDWARFTETDRDEAHERLARLATAFSLRLAAAGSDEWDRPRGESWTLREIAEHVATPWYAEQVGDLGRAGARRHTLVESHSR